MFLAVPPLLVAFVIVNAPVLTALGVIVKLPLDAPVNVPVPNGSCVDLTTELETLPSIEELNLIMKTNSEGDFKNLVGYTDDPIVSSDVIGREETMVFDAKATMITADQLLKTLCWYDNGWGFAKRLIDTIQLYAEDDS